MVNDTPPFSHLNCFLGVPVPMATLSSPACLFFLANRRWYVASQASMALVSVKDDFVVLLAIKVSWNL